MAYAALQQIQPIELAVARSEQGIQTNLKKGLSMTNVRETLSHRKPADMAALDRQMATHSLLFVSRKSKKECL